MSVIITMIVFAKRNSNEVDKETLRFVKYVNDRVNQMPTKGFYDILSVYRE
jgi:hypothetical protein